MPYFVPPSSRAARDDQGRARCSTIYHAPNKELAEHLASHAYTCTDPTKLFNFCPTCTSHRREYFKRQVAAGAAKRFYFRDGKTTASSEQDGSLALEDPTEADAGGKLIKIAYIEISDTTIWAQLHPGEETENAVAAANAFEESVGARDVAWLMKAQDRAEFWLAKRSAPDLPFGTRNPVS